MTNETGLGGTDKLKNFLGLLSPDQKGALLEILLQENKEKKNYGEPIPELVGDFDKVLEYIMNNCVVKQDTELFGDDGSLFIINLPAVGKFEGFKFKFFVDKGRYPQEYYDEAINGSSMGCSMDDIGEMLQKVNEFLMAYGVGDKDITDFSDMLKSWAHGRGNDDLSYLPHFGAGKVLENLLGSGGYRLTDKALTRTHDSRIYLRIYGGGCDFRYSTQNDYNGFWPILKV